MLNNQITAEEKNWGMAAHLSALCMYVGVPFGNILGPLIVWLIKKDSSAHINEQGKEALNFQISMTIYAIIVGVLAFSLIFTLLAIPLAIVLAIVHLILTIIGGVKAANGEEYRYPLTFRFIN